MAKVSPQRKKGRTAQGGPAFFGRDQSTNFTKSAFRGLGAGISPAA